jgi:hypothetical protein
VWATALLGIPGAERDLGRLHAGTVATPSPSAMTISSLALRYLEDAQRPSRYFLWTTPDASDRGAS